MKALIPLTLIATACAATPTLAQDRDVDIKNAVARVAVVVENRSDIGVEIEPGASPLPALQVRRRGGSVEIDGSLRDGGRSRIASCRGGPAGGRAGEGASVEVRGVGRVALNDAPLIVLRVPADIDLDVSGAVFGSIGRGASSVELGNAGCGDWDIANTTGAVSLDMAGSGDTRLGLSRSLDVDIAGSGDVSAGATGSLDVSIAGSGGVNVARVDGPVEVQIAGSGDVTIRGGRASDLEVSIAGSGDVDFAGAAGDVTLNVMGSGDVRVMQATGRVTRRVMGSGNVRIGG